MPNVEKDLRKGMQCKLTYIIPIKIWKILKQYVEKPLPNKNVKTFAFHMLLNDTQERSCPKLNDCLRKV